MLWRRFAESSVVSIGVEHRLVELVHGIGMPPPGQFWPIRPRAQM